MHGEDIGNGDIRKALADLREELALFKRQVAELTKENERLKGKVGPGLLNLDENQVEGLMSELANMGWERNHAERILRIYGFQALREALDRFKASRKKPEKPLVYFRAILEDNFAPVYGVAMPAKRRDRQAVTAESGANESEKDDPFEWERRISHEQARFYSAMADECKAHHDKLGISCQEAELGPVKTAFGNVWPYGYCQFCALVVQRGQK